MTDKNFNGGFPLQVAVVVTSAEQLTAVYALLGGAALFQALKGQAQRGLTAGDMGKPSETGQDGDNAKQDTVKSSATDETLAPENQASAGTGETATTGASPSDGEVDAGGHPWSADLHASTKGKTKDGFWRMKVGVSRPDPLPGYTAATGTTAETPTPSATSQTATAPENGQPATSTEEDDEFAAFRAAAGNSDATDAAAAAAATAAEREYSDADLGALCNQAAVKLGDPAPVKELIAGYVPAGEVAHSRNIPAAKRTEFVSAVEEKAGIKFAG